MSVSAKAAAFLRAVELLDVVENPEDLFPASSSGVTWITIELGELDGLEPAPYHCRSERHDGAGIGADFVEILLDPTAGRLCFWPTCSTCHNVMVQTS